MHEPVLSEREIEVLGLAADGHTDASIAQMLGISEATVATYWGRVRAKLNASSRTEAVAIHMRDENERSVADFRSAFSGLKTELDTFRRANEDAELVQSVFENLPEAILVVDDSLHIALANSAAAQLFGMTKSQLSRTTVDRLVPQSLRAQHRDHVEGFHQTPLAHRMGPHVGVPALHKSGREITIVADLVPIVHNGEPMTLCMLREVLPDMMLKAKAGN